MDRLAGLRAALRARSLSGVVSALTSTRSTWPARPVSSWTAASGTTTWPSSSLPESQTPVTTRSRRRPSSVSTSGSPTAIPDRAASAPPTMASPSRAGQVPVTSHHDRRVDRAGSNRSRRRRSAGQRRGEHGDPLGDVVELPLGDQRLGPEATRHTGLPVDGVGGTAGEADGEGEGAGAQGGGRRTDAHDGVSSGVGSGTGETCLDRRSSRTNSVISRASTAAWAVRVSTVG